ncbi:gamma-glutamyl-gamma-aminobutyrate hydrolase family protein [Actinomadura roseirufa]|uniref:gamma-glutamyl-gamma-aminobutyrate hydrolase family protein n=1 Tax=Actinomadura roseirufa TaxID=2094049 RepID=UPI0013F15AF6|nr:gamma-glutamyl-gamma-aminobutyrate hydrolase family protein [Actinomadura roseirufa]
MTSVGILVARRREFYKVHRSYVDCVLAAGGTPLLIPTSVIDGRLAEAVELVDAMLVTGGGDIQPERYGAAASTTLTEVDMERDEAELRAFAHATARGLRVLGVCRGAQLMTVATGGRLVQDLPAAGFAPHLDTRNDQGYAALRHGIKTESGSLIDHLLHGVDTVNSHHHQSIADPGNLLRATAWAPDGVIEAVEGPGLLGVQWHPETELRTDRRHLRLFRWLVQGELTQGERNPGDGL